MSFLENEFQKRFNNQKLSGDDLDSDGLWDEIANDLETAPAGKANSFWDLKWASIFGFVLLMIGVIGFAYWQMSDTNSIVENHETAKIESTDKRNIEITQTPEKKKTTASEQTLEQEIITNQTIENSQAAIRKSNSISKTEIKNQTFKNEKNDNSVQITAIEKIEKENSFLVNENGVHKSDEMFLLNKLENKTNYTRNDLQGIFSQNIESSKSNSKKGKASDELPQLPFVATKLQSNKFWMPKLEIADVSNKIEKIKGVLPWQLELIGGVNVLDIKSNSTLFFTDIADERNEFIKRYPGFSLGLNVGYQFKNGILISTGAGYHQLWTKLDYEKEKEVGVFKQQELVKVWVSIDGDTLSQLRKDTTLKALENRIVVHHNKFERLTIPIEFGIRKKSGRFIYGVSTGPIFSYMISEKGKTISYSGEIEELGKSTSKQFSFLELGWRVRPVFGLQMSKNITLSLQPQWTYSYTPELVKDTYLISHNHQFNLNLGVEYGF